jgi:putative transposase
MWRAVDSEGEVLDVLVQPRRDKAAALKLVKKLLKRQGFAPTVIVTDKLGSYRAALQVIGFSRPLWLNRRQTANKLRPTRVNVSKPTRRPSGRLSSASKVRRLSLRKPLLDPAGQF